MTTSLKFKEKSADLDSRSLLLALVKLIHADPKLMLHVSLYHLAQISCSPSVAKSLMIALLQNHQLCWTNCSIQYNSGDAYELHVLEISIIVITCMIVGQIRVK